MAAPTSQPGPSQLHVAYKHDQELALGLLYEAAGRQFEGTEPVSEHVKLAWQLQRSNINTPPEALPALRSTIAGRQAAADWYATRGRSDGGHAHIICALQKTLKTLESIPTAPSPPEFDVENFPPLGA